jgi:predicted nucleic-acid-binding Zn-ribbon protein
MLNYKQLTNLAKTAHTREILERLMKEESPEIKKAWLEEFAKVAECPKCGAHGFRLKRTTLNCKKCGYKIFAKQKF